VVSEQKRVRLIMQVFHSSDIVRDESVAVAKFRVWWHFVVSLKDKATALFNEVRLSGLKNPGFYQAQFGGLSVIMSYGLLTDNVHNPRQVNMQKFANGFFWYVPR